jgi:CheY-like chemotaxis protein
VQPPKSVPLELTYIASSLNQEVKIFDAYANNQSLDNLTNELAKYNPDLVITDMTMPQMTGDEFAQRLLEIQPELPIVLCSGFSERITRPGAKAMGIREFLMKPLVMKDLAVTIRKALGDTKVEG